MAKKRTIVGLDVGRHGLKAAWVDLRLGRPVVTRTEILHIPLNDANPARLIRPWLEKTGISRQRCALAVPARDSVFQSLLLQDDDPRTPVQAVVMEVAKFNEIASESMAHAYAAYGKKNRRLLIIMTKPAVLDSVLGYGESMRINVVDLVPAPVALANVSHAAGTGNASIRAFINMGHTHTEIAFGSAKGILFARSFKIGGGHFTEALRTGTGMSESQADTFKITRTSLNGDDAETTEKLRAVADLWIGEVEAAFASYQNQVRDPELAPEQVVLGGGGSLLKGLRERLQSAVGITTIDADAALAPLLTSKAEHFAVAAGLAITAHGAGKSTVSMLPDYVRHEIIFREKKPYWIASGVAIALSVGVFVVGGIRAMGRQSEQLKSAGRTVKELGNLATRIERREASVEAVTKQCAPVLDLLSMGPMYRDLISLVAESLDPLDWISMISDEYSYYAPTKEEEVLLAKRRGSSPGMRDTRIATPKKGEEEAFPLPPPLPTRFVVEGFTPKANLATVKELITKLTASDLVKSADLIFDDQKVAPDRFLSWVTNSPHSQFVVLVEVEPR